jgi:hypothetical protein
LPPNAPLGIAASNTFVVLLSNVIIE